MGYGHQVVLSVLLLPRWRALWALLPRKPLVRRFPPSLSLLHLPGLLLVLAACRPPRTSFPLAAVSSGPGVTTTSTRASSDACWASFSSGSVVAAILFFPGTATARFSLPDDSMFRAFSFCSSFHLVFGGILLLLSRQHAMQLPSGFFSLWSLPPLPGLGPVSILPAASPASRWMEGSGWLGFPLFLCAGSSPLS